MAYHPCRPGTDPVPGLLGISGRPVSAMNVAGERGDIGVPGTIDLTHDAVPGSVSRS